MIVKSLPSLHKDQEITAAELYAVYTDIWIGREKEEHPLLSPTVKLMRMLELAWQLYTEGVPDIGGKRLAPFVEQLLKSGNIPLV